MTDFFLFVIVFAIICAIFLSSMIVVVRQQTVAIVEVFGRFYTTMGAGIRLKYPFGIARVAGRMNLRLQELQSSVEVKTLDNVFVEIPVSIQYRVLESRVSDAFYALEDPDHQLNSFVLNVIRTAASALSLEHLYTEKSKIAEEVETELKDRLAGYGFAIEAVLIDQPSPPRDVQDAFNRVIAAQREKEAAKLEAEAKRIRIIAEAEAEKESKRLQGEGIAAQRSAIALGFRESIAAIKGASGEGVDDAMIIATLIATNQFDTIREVGAKGNLILMPFSAEGSMNDMAKTIAALEAFHKKEAPETGVPSKGRKS
ncbi:MAG: SPFH domain-containing protein [Candidatus Puniceispirillum sp.]|nr:SPFH domain-containing protein [Candidatus Puniceispirillum sp.]